jgi:hypothetical protein
LIEQYSNDDDSSRKGICPHTVATEWLAQNCYIDTSSSAYDFFDNECRADDQEDSSQYCEVCKRCKLNYRKVYCYTNKGKERQRISICIDCLRKYEEKRYELVGKPRGVVAITAIARMEEMIMTTLRMILMKKKYDKEEDDEEQEKQRAATAMVVLHTTDGDATINTGEDNDDLFYDAVALTYALNPMVREYFHNERSRIRPDNKRLWPLRYHTFKEDGIRFIKIIFSR